MRSSNLLLMVVLKTMHLGDNGNWPLGESKNMLVEMISHWF